MLTIITATYNSANTLGQTVSSVAGQKLKNIEHIIIDGASTDGTLNIIKKSKAIWCSEPDQGIYDAMNKGIKLAKGDIIGILNSDDVYANDQVLAKVANVFEETGADAVYGDLDYVAQNNLQKVVRHWKAGEFKPGSFKSGWMPPHPTFFVKKKVYEKHGLFNLALPLAADYEIMLRFLEAKKIKVAYLPEVLVKMRLGGASNKNIQNLLQNYKENLVAWKVNNLNPAWYTNLLKRLRKLPQFFKS